MMQNLSQHFFVVDINDEFIERITEATKIQHSGAILGIIMLMYQIPVFSHTRFF